MSVFTAGASFVTQAPLPAWSRSVTPTRRVARSGCCFAACCTRLLALGLIIVDKRYDHLGKIRRWLVDRRLSGAGRGREPVRGLALVPRKRQHARRAARRQGPARGGSAPGAIPLQRYEALEAESQRLRALRDNTATSPTGSSSATSWTWTSTHFASACWSTRARSDGVFVGQAVLDAGGVFGQVARVERTHQRSHPGQRPCARHPGPDQPQRTCAPSRWARATPRRLKLPYLPTSADVVVGDLLVTSGLGGGFPAGYPVGTVTTGQARSGPVAGRGRRSARPRRSTARASSCSCGSSRTAPAATTAESTAPPPSTAATAAARRPPRRPRRNRRHKTRRKRSAAAKAPSRPRRRACPAKAPPPRLCPRPERATP